MNRGLQQQQQQHEQQAHQQQTHGIAAPEGWRGVCSDVWLQGGGDIGRSSRCFSTSSDTNARIDGGVNPPVFYATLEQKNAARAYYKLPPLQPYRGPPQGIPPRAPMPPIPDWLLQGRRDPDLVGHSGQQRRNLSDGRQRREIIGGQQQRDVDHSGQSYRHRTHPSLAFFSKRSQRRVSRCKLCITRASCYPHTQSAHLLLGPTRTHHIL